ncbi:hypothetical protein IEE_02059 [Bacillus cereus BAG5X1-1]|uniref:Uncharacterized protein n=1 Tax=Bacillus cereus BAG5X1-1 TaxID=1053189 RepID=J8ASE6_BACCE|nr:hypothetical protein [Bacillus cereus]EJQ45937.1 hypothetical protein IEE_02059 [Bacillus cereus BAG5X1-1]PGY19320.1 hypothetical protein COE23_00060 [Bacillus cereus]WJE24952.1 hypothetical protein QRE65_24530 [Bacillus cereus]
MEQILKIEEHQEKVRWSSVFVTYNEHNGYYGHEAKVISKQIKHDEMVNEDGRQKLNSAISKLEVLIRNAIK